MKRLYFTFDPVVILTYPQCYFTVTTLHREQTIPTYKIQGTLCVVHCSLPKQIRQPCWILSPSEVSSRTAMIDSIIGFQRSGYPQSNQVWYVYVSVFLKSLLYSVWFSYHVSSCIPRLGVISSLFHVLNMGILCSEYLTDTGCGWAPTGSLVSEWPNWPHKQNRRSIFVHYLSVSINIVGISMRP